MNDIFATTRTFDFGWEGDVVVLMNDDGGARRSEGAMGRELDSSGRPHRGGLDYCGRDAGIIVCAAGGVVSSVPPHERRDKHLIVEQDGHVESD
jgi:hypothetical protein